MSSTVGGMVSVSEERQILYTDRTSSTSVYFLVISIEIDIIKTR